MDEIDDISLPPTDGHIWPPSVMVARARVARSLAASAIVTGSTDPQALVSYRRWLVISLLLGDVDYDHAAASLGRAENIFAINLDAMKDSPP